MAKSKKLNYTTISRDALKIMMSITDGAHNVEHIVRVYDWCRELAKNYPKADLNVLKVAAYWHDVGRKYESKEKDDHNEKSSFEVEKYLRKQKASEEFISKVKYAVENHSFKFSPKTIEGKILHDADKLAFMSDHAVPDVLNSMKEGYETARFKRKHLKKGLTAFYDNQDYLYNGMMLSESKNYYRIIKKDFIKIIKEVIDQI
ncbi:HD domain-containing protein [Patescibacteria group bacterium]